MIDIVLIGGGGHCSSVIDTIRSLNTYNIVGVTDIDILGSDINGVKVIGTDEILIDLYKNGVRNAFITVGSIGNVSIRKKIYLMLKELGYELPVIIDKSAIVSSSVTIGSGSFIGKGCIINADSKIDKNCIINTGSIIEHNCTLGEFVHIAPGSVLSGGVFIGDNSHIGTNSTVIQNIVVHSDVLIGAGSVVVKNIDSNRIAYGNPCE